MRFLSIINFVHASGYFFTSAIQNFKNFLQHRELPEIIDDTWEKTLEFYEKMKNNVITTIELKNKNIETSNVMHLLGFMISLNKNEIYLQKLEDLVSHFFKFNEKEIRIVMKFEIKTNFFVLKTDELENETKKIYEKIQNLIKSSNYNLETLLFKIKIKKQITSLKDTLENLLDDNFEDCKKYDFIFILNEKSFLTAKNQFKHGFTNFINNIRIKEKSLPCLIFDVGNTFDQTEAEENMKELSKTFNFTVMMEFYNFNNNKLKHGFIVFENCESLNFNPIDTQVEIIRRIENIKTGGKNYEEVEFKDFSMTEKNKEIYLNHCICRKYESLTDGFQFKIDYKFFNGEIDSMRFMFELRKDPYIICGYRKFIMNFTYYAGEVNLEEKVKKIEKSWFRQDETKKLPVQEICVILENFFKEKNDHNEKSLEINFKKKLKEIKTKKDKKNNLNMLNFKNYSILLDNVKKLYKPDLIVYYFSDDFKNIVNLMEKNCYFMTTPYSQCIEILSSDQQYKYFYKKIIRNYEILSYVKKEEVSVYNFEIDNLFINSYIKNDSDHIKEILNEENFPYFKNFILRCKKFQKCPWGLNKILGEKNHGLFCVLKINNDSKFYLRIIKKRKYGTIKELKIEYTIKIFLENELELLKSQKFYPNQEYANVFIEKIDKLLQRIKFTITTSQIIEEFCSIMKFNRIAANSKIINQRKRSKNYLKYLDPIPEEININEEYIEDFEKRFYNIINREEHKDHIYAVYFFRTCQTIVNTS